MSNSVASSTLREVGLARVERSPDLCFPIRRFDDGRALLNLACGTRMHPSWNNLDFSLYATFSKYPVLSGLLHKVGVISPNRYCRLLAVDPKIIRWDLRRGIPFASESFNAVYHSHFLEHLNRQAALEFLQECKRVLRKGGILRIVVPDLRLLATRYIQSLTALEAGDVVAPAAHERAIYELIDQMVRTETSGTLEQAGWIRRLEGLVRGGAARVGELHQWMYDEYSLGRILQALGFEGIRSETAVTSRIRGWESFRLDVEGHDSPSKPESLYLEATK